MQPNLRRKNNQNVEGFLMLFACKTARLIDNHQITADKASVFVDKR
jgi:hypothetical protein